MTQLSKTSISFFLKKNSGLTLIESMIGIAIFTLLAGIVYQTFFTISKQSSANLENTTLSYIASQYLEAVRNLPYANIGTIQGNPDGNLPDQNNPSIQTISGKTYNIYYEVTYIDDPADGTILGGNDSAPNDYKQVKLKVNNNSTGKITTFITNVVQSGLENLTNGGALSISVIDAVGQPVPNATIRITNATENIDLTRLSNSSGKWVEVGIPNGSNSYHIEVSKTGYSSDKTYPITLANPNPVKPDATISNGQVTAITFAIDKVSNLTFNTIDQSCAGIPNVGLGIRGEKIIGTNPNILKFDNNYTSNSSGLIALSNIEWDNYTTALAGNTYMIYGSSPIQETNLFPNTNQTFNLILGAKTANSLLVLVKDGLTGNPIEGASVELQNGDLGLDETRITGGSLWSQQYWDSGPGQDSWVNIHKYFTDDGNINTTDIPLAIRLINNGSQVIATSGYLISSTFDTGSTGTTYTTINWQPTSQDPEATVKFQIATNNDNTTWNFVGPDGTGNTYYTTPNASINTQHNNQRYIRYKAFISTTNINKNPVLTSVGINYISGCFTPGQVIFPGLTKSDEYSLSITANGYQPKTIPSLQIENYQTIEITLDLL